jgi:hypothetical protein
MQFYSTSACVCVNLWFGFRWLMTISSWRTTLNTVINCRLLKEAGNPQTSFATISSSRITVCHDAWPVLTTEHDSESLNWLWCQLLTDQFGNTTAYEFFVYPRPRSPTHQLISAHTNPLDTKPINSRTPTLHCIQSPLVSSNSVRYVIPTYIHTVTS